MVESRDFLLLGVNMAKKDYHSNFYKKKRREDRKIRKKRKRHYGIDGRKSIEKTIHKHKKPIKKK